MGGRKVGAISKSRGLKRPAAKASKAVSGFSATGKQAKKQGAESAASASASGASAASAAAERAFRKRVTDEVEAVDAAEVETGANSGGDDSDDILLSDSQLYWIRVEPAGDRMCSFIRKPFYVVAAASTRVYDLKESICTVHRIHHRNQTISHVGNLLRNKVIQGMYYQDMIHPLFGIRE